MDECEPDGERKNVHHVREMLFFSLAARHLFSFPSVARLHTSLLSAHSELRMTAN